MRTLRVAAALVAFSLRARAFRHPYYRLPREPRQRGAPLVRWATGLEFTLPHARQAAGRVTVVTFTFDAFGDKAQGRVWFLQTSAAAQVVTLRLHRSTTVLSLVRRKGRRPLVKHLRLTSGDAP